jgi:hypothetical protein
MFRSLSNSWQLVKASWAVLRADKELLWFPVLSGLTMLVVTIVFFIPLSAIFALFGVSTGSEATNEIIGYVLLFIYYLLSYTVVYYFNTALIGAAMIRLDGGDPTMRDGLRIAGERMGVIVQYALISATVGLVLRFLQERGGIVGSIVSWLGGVVWNVATFLVVPVLVVKEVSPIDAIKESAQLLRKTWGEQITFGFGVGAFFGLLTFGVVIIGMGITFALFSTLQSPVALIGIPVVILAVIAIGIVSSAMNGVFQALLYRYAEVGVVPDDFDIALIEGAFKPKKKR